MPIFEKDGQTRSEWSAEEQLYMLQQDLSKLSKEDQALVRRLLAEKLLHGDTNGTLYDELVSQHYKRTPVSVEQFVRDQYYLGSTCDVIFPVLLEDLKEIFAGDYTEIIFSGSIGYGKTFVCSIGICYILYKLSCLKDPQRSLGLSSDTPVSVAAFSATEDLAREVVLKNVIGKIGASPYFEKHMRFKATQKNIRFENNVIMVARSTTPRSALGTSPVAALIDECLHADSKVLLATGEEVRVEELCGKSAEVVTFKSDRVETGTLYVKRSTRQRCYAVTTSSGACLKASWNHPVAVLMGNRVAFCLVEDLIDGDEVLTLEDVYDQARNRQSVLRKTPFRRNKKAHIRCSKRKISTAPKSRDMCEIIGGVEGTTAVGECSEGILGENEKEVRRGTRDYCTSYRREERYVRETPFTGNTEEIVRGASRKESLPGDKEEDVRRAPREEGSLRRIQTGFSGQEPFAERGVQTFSRNVSEDLRIQCVEDAKGSVLTSIPCSNIQGTTKFVRCSKPLGGSGRRTTGERPAYSLVSVRRVESFIRATGGAKVHHPRLSSHPGGEPDTARRSETEGLHVLGERKGKVIRHEGLLQPELVGVCNMGRTVSVARVVSKKDLGVCATYDVCVPGTEVLVADRVVVHNSNFMPKRRSKDTDGRYGLVNMAKDIYDNMVRRIKSRYGNQGKVFLPSSKASKGSFLSTRIHEVKEANDPSVFVRDYAYWDVRPGPFSEKRFYVLCGNEQINSAILAGPAEADEMRQRDLERVVVIAVPEDFKGDFERDLEGSIRDFAGVETIAVSPFFQRHSAIEEMVDPRTHPFTAITYDPSSNAWFDDELLFKEIFDPEIGDYIKSPRLHPYAPRHVHIDPALNDCSAGFCVGHIAGTVETQGLYRTGDQKTERAPLFVIDIILEIVPPVGGVLEFSLYRKMIDYLRENGMPIVSISMDSWQSFDSLQIMQHKGYVTSTISLDRSWDPYKHLKDALYENRVRCYRYGPLLQELHGLECDWANKKVIKPEGGSKDVADSAAGCLYGLIRSEVSIAPPMLRGLSDDDLSDAWMTEEVQADLAKKLMKGDYRKSEKDLLSFFMDVTATESDDDGNS